MQTRTARVRVTDEVVLWRRTQLVESGFSPTHAARIAEDARYDLHALIGIVERGCPPELAARILAPIDLECAS
jgi:hypothetical protein